MINRKSLAYFGIAILSRWLLADMAFSGGAIMADLGLTPAAGDWLKFALGASRCTRTEGQSL